MGLAALAETTPQGLVAEPVFQTVILTPSVNDEKVPTAANDAAPLDADPHTPQEVVSALSQVSTIGTVTVPIQAQQVANESLASFVDERVKGNNTKIVGSEVKKVVSPEAILNISLQGQIAALHSQVQNLLKQIMGERTQAQKAVLDATLKVQNDITKLRILLQSKDEVIIGNNELIGKLNAEIKNLKEKISDLELALKEADTFMSGHPNLLEANLVENKNSGGLEVREKVEPHPMIAVLLSRVEVLQNSVLRVATTDLNDRAYELTDGGLSGAPDATKSVVVATAAPINNVPMDTNQVSTQKADTGSTAALSTVVPSLQEDSLVISGPAETAPVVTDSVIKESVPTPIIPTIVEAVAETRIDSPEITGDINESDVKEVPPPQPESTQTKESTPLVKTDFEATPQSLSNETSPDITKTETEIIEESKEKDTITLAKVRELLASIGAGGTTRQEVGRSLNSACGLSDIGPDIEAIQKAAGEKAAGDRFILSLLTRQIPEEV